MNVSLCSELFSERKDEQQLKRRLKYGEVAEWTKALPC